MLGWESGISRLGNSEGETDDWSHNNQWNFHSPCLTRSYQEPGEVGIFLSFADEKDEIPRGYDSSKVSNKTGTGADLCWQPAAPISGCRCGLMTHHCTVWCPGSLGREESSASGSVGAGAYCLCPSPSSTPPWSVILGKLLNLFLDL